MMLEEVNTDEYAIAEMLGMTRAELLGTMGEDEFHGWRAFITYRAAMQEKAQRAARAQAGAHGSRG